MTRSDARFNFAADTIFMALVICCVFLTDLMRRGMSKRLAMPIHHPEAVKDSSQGKRKRRPWNSVKNIYPHPEGVQRVFPFEAWLRPFRARSSCTVRS